MSPRYALGRRRCSVSAALSQSAYPWSMDPETARRLLLDERESLLRMGRDLDATFHDIVDAAADSNLDDEHDTEGGTIAAERSLVSSLGRSATDRVAQIDKALARIDDGTFGVCLRCGGPIGDGRLEARPAATECISCASIKPP